MLLELAYSAGSPFISDVMRLGFQREAEEERGWVSFLHGWCVHVADRLVYLNAIIQELEYCSGNMFAAQLLVALRSGDDVVFVDAIMYFKTIRDFGAQKLENLQLFWRRLKWSLPGVCSLLLGLAPCNILAISTLSKSVCLEMLLYVLTLLVPLLLYHVFIVCLI
ncbi:hypothetical protein CTI12_AA244110 [Artemisia annua]|uniref:Uncharacterized protein n=1 Tax=Artemisia annua TaxID=35608 RepID=A0A2U1NNH9_ARTAN|nr:hypothetical protein CTI12_AA244110 [Artemisia annua]